MRSLSPAAAPPLAEALPEARAETVAEAGALAASLFAAAGLGALGARVGAALEGQEVDAEVRRLPRNGVTRVRRSMACTAVRQLGRGGVTHRRVF